MTTSLWTTPPDRHRAPTYDPFVALSFVAMTGSFSFSDLHVTLKPSRQPHPPIWVGGLSDAALRHAAVFAEVWQSHARAVVVETPHSFLHSVCLRSCLHLSWPRKGIGVASPLPLSCSTAIASSESGRASRRSANTDSRIPSRMESMSHAAKRRDPTSEQVGIWFDAVDEVWRRCVKKTNMD